MEKLCSVQLPLGSHRQVPVVELLKGICVGAVLREREDKKDKPVFSPIEQLCKPKQLEQD